MASRQTRAASIALAGTLLVLAAAGAVRTRWLLEVEAHGWTGLAAAPPTGIARCVLHSSW